MTKAKETLTLISKRGCPFAQRTAIVLAAKGLPFELVEIDVDNKPDWFAAMSPLGKVPVLVHGGEVLAESLAITEYLEEIAQDPRLSPVHPADKARMRFWMLFDETRLTPAFYRLLLSAEETEANMREAYENSLSTFVNDGLAKVDPFILGQEISLADITLITHLQRLPFLIKHRGVSMTKEETTVLERWMAAVNRHPAVAKASPTWAVMTQDLEPYIARRASGATAKDIMAGLEKVHAP